MKTLLIVLVVLALGAGLYTLVVGGVGGLVGAGRSGRRGSDGNDDPFDGPTDLRRTTGDD